ncbi:MAG: hypothetical protein ACOCXG_05375 [Nanoarchaeota archaeon]
MKVYDTNLIFELTENFCKIVEKYCDYVIISGLTAIASGRTRGTEDIDILLPRLSKEKFVALHKELSNNFEVIETDDIDEMYERLMKDNSNIRYVKKETIVPNMEVKFAKDELDLISLDERKKYAFSDCDVFFAPIEATIAFKETLLTSEKDKEDARHLRVTFDELLNEEKINQFKELIGRLR